LVALHHRIFDAVQAVVVTRGERLTPIFRLETAVAG